MSETVKITFEIDGIEYTVDQLNELAQTARESEDASVAAGESISKTTAAVGNAAKEANQKVESSTKKAGDAIKQTNDEIIDGAKEATTETGFLGEQFRKIGDFSKKLKADFMGGFQAIQKFGQGLGFSAKASKGLAVGLSALGIPLLLAGIAALIDYFKNFEAGAKLLEKALNVVGAVIQQVTKAFIALINLDFSGLVDAVKGVGDAAIEAARGTDELFESQRALEQLQNKSVVANAKLRKSIELNRKVLEDETASFEDRMDALKVINEDTQNLAQAEIELAESTLRNLQAQLALEKNYEKRIELEAQIAETQAGLIDKQTALEVIQFEAAKKERELIQRQTEERQAAAEKALEIRKQFYAQLTTLEQQNELARIKDVDARAKRQLEIERQNAIKEIELAEFTAEQKAQLIKEVNTAFDLQEEARQDAVDEKTIEKTRQAAEKLATVENEIALLRIEDEQKRAQLALQQQEEAAIAAVAGVENEEALKEAIREKYRLLREQQDKTYEEKRNAERFANLEKDILFQEESFLQTDAITRSQREKQLQDVRDYFNQLLADETLTTEQREKINQEFVKTIDGVQKQIVANQQQSIDALQGTFAALGSLFEEGSAAAKGFAVADAIINTYKAANVALASAPPPFNFILAGANIAAGIANVQKILSTEPGDTAAAGGTTTPAIPAPPPTPTASTIFSASGQASGATTQTLQNQQQALEGAANETEMPIKTYVIASDVTSAQEANKKIENLSKL